MQPSYDRDIWERIGPVLVPIGRTVAGLALAVVLSMVGIAVAWSLFVFSGVQSLEAWLGTLFFGGGLGAGTGTFVAWLHLDRENNWVLLLTAVVVIGAGVAGSWIGYVYGQNQEVECCAMPTVSPVYYTAIGSALVANAAGIVFAGVRAFITRKRQTQFHNAVR